MKNSAKIFISGVGVRVPHNITVRLLQALEECDRIVTILNHDLDLWIPDSVDRKKVLSLRKLIRPDRRRSDNYREITKEVISLAESGENICFVTYGNPFTFDSVCSGILAECEKLEIDFEVIDAVSFIDTAFNAMRYDLAPGVLVYEATLFVIDEIEPSKHIALLLTQVDVFRNRRIREDIGEDSANLQMLQDYLMRFFPPAHAIKIVSMPDFLTDRVQKIRIGEIGVLQSHDIGGSSLYIPPLEAPERTVDRIRNVFTN